MEIYLKDKNFEVRQPLSGNGGEWKKLTILPW
jgi:hypothetical protein